MGFSIGNPDFGNIYQTECVSVHRESIGGDLILFKDSSWPDIKSFTVVFSYFDSIERDQFIQFFLQTQGKEVTYIDHENVTWFGVITSPTIDFIQLDGSKSVDINHPINTKFCSFSTSFTFEGKTL